MSAQPQDHKQKAKPFTFKGADGETYTIPNVSEAHDKLSGSDIEDALLAGDAGMTAYIVKCLRVSGISEQAHKALRGLPSSEYMDVIKAWGEHGDGDGATLGE